MAATGDEAITLKQFNDYTQAYVRFYEPGDNTESFSYTTVPGFVTNNNTRLYFSIPLDRRVRATTTIEFSDSMSWIVRGVNGYIEPFSDSSGVSVKDNCNITFKSMSTGSHSSVNGFVTMQDESEFENATNNTPAAIYITSGYLNFS